MMASGFMLLMLMAFLPSSQPVSAPALMPAQQVTFQDVFTGKIAPLTRTLGSLDGSWVRLRIADTPEGDAAVRPGTAVIYTQGMLVTTGEQTYLVGYGIVQPAAAEREDASKPATLTKDTPLSITLCQVSTLSNVLDVHPFNLTEEINPPHSRPSTRDIAEQSTQTMRELAVTVIMWTQDNGEKMPPLNDPAALRKALQPYMENAMENANVLIHPYTGVPYQFNLRLSNKPLRTIADQMRTVLAYEAEDDADGRRLVAFVDAHVERVDQDRWQELLQRSGSGLQSDADLIAISQARLKRLAVAVQMYAQDHAGQLPPLGTQEAAKLTLMPYLADESSLLNPFSEEPYIFNAKISTRVARSVKNPETTMLAAEATPAPDGSYGVLYVDGHIARVDTKP